MEAVWVGHEYPGELRIKNLDLRWELLGIDRADLRMSSTDRWDLAPGDSEHLRRFH